MFKDPGSSANLGFGVQSRQIASLQQTDEGSDPKGSFISKALNDHPMMKFFATSAAAVAGMVVAGKVVRHGGVRLLTKMQESEVPWATRAVANIRKSRDLFDTWEGVQRDLDYYKADNIQKLFIRESEDAPWSSAYVDRVYGFHASKAQSDAAKAGLDVDPIEWTLRREMQQRMVSQARRLPYELPGMYIAEKTVVDPLFGRDDDKRKINWYNPVDVMSDFVNRSVTNLATMMVPLEGVSGGASYGWKKFMSYGDDLAKLTPKQAQVQTASVAMQTLLGQVGVSASELMMNTLKISSQSSGAFAAAINDASQSSATMKDWYAKGKAGWRKANDDLAAGKIDRRQALKAQASSVFNMDFIDGLPGPYHGMASGIRAGKEKWKAIDTGYKDFEDLMSIGRGRFDAKFGTDLTKKREAYAGMASVMGSGESSIEELAGLISKWGQGGPGSRAWFHGQFYQTMAQNEYQKILMSHLQTGYGVSEKGALKFATEAKVRLPNLNAESQMHFAQRLHFGNVGLMGESSDDVAGIFRERLSKFAPDDQVKLNTAFEHGRAINEVDTIYGRPGFKKSLDRKIERQWSHINRHIIPQYGESILGGQARLPFEDFAGGFTASQRSFMQRKTAQLSGLNMVDHLGNPVDNAVVRNHLARKGFNASNPFELRGYLQSKKVISNSWSQAGRNVFGLRNLTVAGALEKGYFRGGDMTEREVVKLTSNLGRRDPVSNTIGQLRMRGVYETPTGKVVDFTQLTRRSTRFFDKIADELQIPLIGIKPFQTMGSRVFRNWREREMMQIIPSMTKQPFTNAQAAVEDDFYLWLRRGGRGSKGDIFGVQGLSHRKLQGTYRPFATDAFDMAARHARLAAGDTGDVAYPNTKLRNNKFRNMFSVDPNQPDSFFRFMQRFKNRNTDIRNPMVMARLLEDGQATVGGKIIKLTPGGEVVDEAGKVLHSGRAVTEAFGEFQGTIRKHAFGGKVMDELSGSDSLRERLLTYDFTGMETTHLRPGKVRIDKLSTVGEIEEAQRLIAKGDASNLSSLPKAQREALERARRTYIYSHSNKATGASWWDSPVSQAARSTNIHTRLDAARADLNKYLFARQNALKPGEYQSLIADLEANLLSLQKAGKITQSELSETRAALLSTQVNLVSFGSYKLGALPFEHQLSVMQGISRGRTPGVTGGLRALRSGQIGNESSWYTRRGKAALRRLKPAEPPRPVNVNPFGSETVFVPTFGTTFARNKLGSVSSVLGLNTWNNPDAFSGASIPISHMFERINRYGSMLSGSLKADDFKSPLDFYARGVIGKRVLPITAAGTTAITADRMAGGLVNDRDENGDRVYSPLVLGGMADVAAHGSIALAGILPGGETAAQKREELYNGEVPVRSGRWWPLGNTPWRGGRIQYYRPSWLRRLKSGYQYTDQTHGSPLERLMFGYDFSPLRPLDPYRFEREHYEDRPYPVTGDYFTGPWGPLTPALNMTVGRLLKRPKRMHEEELAQGLADYQRVGEAGAYMPAVGFTGGMGGGVGMGGYGAVGGGGGVGTSSGAYMLGGGSGTGVSGGAAMVSGINASYSAASGSTSRGSMISTSAIGAMNSSLSASAYGVPATQRGAFNPSIIGAAPPSSPASLGFQAKELAYKTQELFGIYGFAFGAVRQKLGLGEQDFGNSRPTLATAGAAYGSTRGFWDMHLGGLGDVPTPIEGRFSNLEFSEIIRRFIPKQRSGVEVVNPIRNQMGEEYPWLPGADYYTNFKQGDPYTAIGEGEMRLPGKGYERLHDLHPDQSGAYGVLDQFKILGDVAPWSAEYRALDRQMDSMGLSGPSRELVDTVRSQVAAKNEKVDFTPYKYKYSSPEETGLTRSEHFIAKHIEGLAHQNSYFNTKFMPVQTSVEDWERNNVFGATFPQWQKPIEGYVKPLIYNSSERNPFSAGLILGAVGSLFGATKGAKAIGSVIGAGVGFTAGVGGAVLRNVSEERWMPAYRRKEIALEEYTDILSYVKALRNRHQAMQTGDTAAASYFTKQAQQTMYGADIYQGDANDLAAAIPKRKREHFKDMLMAPPQEREQILSTAGRLERRLLEGAWGMPVEQRPDLESYFQNKELPSADWEGWHPNTNMDHVKVKIAQSIGLDLSEMGYYPQQVQEANLVNPSYPSFQMNDQGRVAQRLRDLMRAQGINGEVTPVPTPYSGTRIQMSAGVF